MVLNWLHRCINKISFSGRHFGVPGHDGFNIYLVKIGF